jgi:hypothetical protein
VEFGTHQIGIELGAVPQLTIFDDSRHRNQCFLLRLSVIATSAQPIVTKIDRISIETRPKATGDEGDDFQMATPVSDIEEKKVEVSRECRKRNLTCCNSNVHQDRTDYPS